ncbi:hypothetical protein Poly30_39830 [Planctomycetes bacterium Poly30]|uniref:Uncharacterized protein n=1 Tax=Saltatorellus ferox TaxID=2528018 RepID=A0A518EWJ0_9BACT|nr:hypothetical protein Poly30_39830 [Planctomycetes bacterium Poly30]
MKLPISPSNPSRRNSGVVLIWSVFAAILILGSTFVTATLSRTANLRAQLAVKRGGAEALSHAAVEAAMESIRTHLRRNQEPPVTGTFTVDGEVATYTIQREAAPLNQRTVGGLQQFGSIFRVVGTGTVGDITKSTRRMARASVIPVFQFAIYYENDLEFFNPAPWEIKGRIHCNSDIYVRVQAPLTFDTNYLHCAGSFYGRAPHATWAPIAGVEPTIRRWVADPFDPSAWADWSALPIVETYAASGVTTSGGLDTDFTGADLNGDGDFTDANEYASFLAGTVGLFGPTGGGPESTLMTSEHGVLPLAPPEAEDFSPFTPTVGGDFVYDPVADAYTPVTPGSGTHSMGSYHKEAGLVIRTLPDGTWSARDETGADLTAAIASAVTSGSIYDTRQAADGPGSLQQLELDLGALAASGHFPANGLIYMVGEGAGTGTDAKAFTLKNGATLPSGLTVVTPNSIYLQGDYNTNSPKPASLIADAANLLSNAWDNSKTPGTLPTATETTYNVSIIAGDTPSTSSGTNGGPHNLPRRHEDWTGVNEYLNGSIVCPFRSQYATADFVLGGNYYFPPDRFWAFDERNNDPTTLPPFTPMTVEVDAMVTWSAKP